MFVYVLFNNTFVCSDDTVQSDRITSAIWIVTFLSTCVIYCSFSLY